MKHIHRCFYDGIVGGTPGNCLGMSGIFQFWLVYLNLWKHFHLIL